MSDDYEVDGLYADDGGTFDRQELLRRGAAAGLAIPTISLLFGANAAFARPSARPLTPTFYQWIDDLHPDIPDGQQAVPRSTTGREDRPGPRLRHRALRRRGKQEEEHLGRLCRQTPFVEMAALIKAGVIEPWDNYIPKEVIDDIIPSILDEDAPIDGKLWLAVPARRHHQARDAELGQKAELDPEPPGDLGRADLPKAKTVVDKKAAPCGATFDAHGWRSLAPITHSMSTERLHARGPVRLHQRRQRSKR